MYSVFVKGFASGISIIAAIGAQNAFVLSQGVKKNSIFLIPLICIICDALFISIGVAGMGKLAQTGKNLNTVISSAGAVFLFFYGFKSLMSVFKSRKLDIDSQQAKGIKIIITSTLGVTLLNPHFYLDTVFLMGGISSGIDQGLKPYFLMGAVSASFTWFFLLSLGASVLAPFFKNEISWKLLDTFVSFIMFYIGFSLIKNLF
jgi:L-lysine exporter family protein LysE/ArgO